ncbi:MAG: hypothetical protein ABIH63_00585 [archaeon]
MIEKLKKMSAILVAILGILVLSTTAIASELQLENFNVKVDDIDAEGSIVYVERGQEIPVEVKFTALDNYDNVRVKAWIGGYEYDDVKDTSGIFDIQEGITYKKTLKLVIPEDIDVKDDEDTYSLRVEVYNDDYTNEESFELRIKEQRHRLAIQDIILRPGSTVQAGQALFATVRVENLGDKKEEDIRITVSIPDLGIAQRTYIDELTAHEENNEDEESSMSSEEIYLRIPADAKTGFYTVNIDVEYSRGHEIVSATGKIYIQGTAAEAETPEEQTKTVVGTDATTKMVKQGDEVAYKVMIANMGSTPQIYSVEVSGEKLWGISRVDPAFAKIQNDATGEMYVYIKANDDATVGKQMFTVKVKAGDTIVDEKTLTADVTAKEAPVTQVGSLRNALIIGFGVLVVLLIIIGLIVLFNRMSKEEEPGEIPSSEGQAYY